MLPFLLAVVLAVAASWWSWRDRLDRPLTWLAALARAMGLAALLLLLLDPGINRNHLAQRPLVLLDNSVSMHASHGQAAEAARLGATLGDTVSFGELARGEPGDGSLLHDPLAAAVASGRAVAVVTDGEIADINAIPADLLAQVAVRLVPRAPGADIALTEVQGASRLTTGDTLTLDVEAERTADAPDSVAIVVRDSALILARGVLRFGTGTRGRIRLTGVLPRALRGDRWLTVARIGSADAEPDDDQRLWRLTITPTPGVVVIADTPDWDSRALYRALKDVVEVPIRGYAQLQRGQWRRMDDLRPVSASDVVAAAKSADLLAVRGDAKNWRTFGRARLLWPSATDAGDWYIAVGGASPLISAFAGADADSLPPVVGVAPIAGDTAHSWVAATARLSRRGTPVPVIGGSEDRSSRSVTIGVDGLYRWGMRGGLAEQVWRTMIADAATWLLAAPEEKSARARVTSSVTQRGRPVHFHWTGGGLPVPVTVQLHSTLGARIDTLRFNGESDASIAVGVGRYSYAIDGGGTGSFAVEPYSDELIPSPMTLRERVGSAATAAPRRSLRELVWLFGVAIAGFGMEWTLRRRLGLR